MKDTSSWTTRFIVGLGAEFVPEVDPARLCSTYNAVSAADIPEALVKDDASDSSVSSIHGWLALLRLPRSSCAPAVGRYVGEVMHACRMGDRKRVFLVPQQKLEFSLGDFNVVSVPDLALSCVSAADARRTYPLVVEASNVARGDFLAWGQIVGEMVAAAMDDLSSGAAAKWTSVYGIRVVRTRWTFLRADFAVDYLARLDEFQLLPHDRFRVYAWGGEDATRTERQRDDLQWGLDFNVPAQREQIARMLVALGRRTKEVAEGRV